MHRSLSARRAWIEIVAACPFSCCGTVALRKESVDRNSSGLPVFLLRHWSLSARRAWIEILSASIIQSRFISSLSARRAWIEISAWGPHGTVSGVALRKESVDRNAERMKVGGIDVAVALRKESVDRNIKREMSLIRPYGRSPQGERG